MAPIDQKHLFSECISSKDGTGGRLLQNGKPIFFTNRCVKKLEHNFAVEEEEFLSIVHCIIKFLQSIYEHSVIVKTNYKPLITIVT